jgi:hypothetical protein
VYHSGFSDVHFENNKDGYIYPLILTKSTESLYYCQARETYRGALVRHHSVLGESIDLHKKYTTYVERGRDEVAKTHQRQRSPDKGSAFSSPNIAHSERRSQVDKSHRSCSEAPHT